MLLRIFPIVLLSLFFGSLARADIIYFYGGDQLTGEIVEDSLDYFVMKNDAVGLVTVKKEAIEAVEIAGVTDVVVQEEMTQAIQDDLLERQEAVDPWTKKVSFGYTESGGTTDNSRATLTVKFNHRKDKDEWLIEGRSYYATHEGRQTGLEYYGQIRRNNRIQEKSSWFSIYTFEWDRNKFSNIDSRFLPSVGLGYWFSERYKWKALAETSIGYEYTNYRERTKNEGELTLLPRLFLERMLWKGIRFTQDVTFYPAIGATRVFRLRSETALLMPLTRKVGWRFSFQDNYRSNPVGNAEKNDYRFITAIDYLF